MTMPPPSNIRCGNLNRFANTGTVCDLFNERGRVGLERGGRVSLGKGAVERVGAGAVAAQHRLPHAVGIDQHAGHGVTLAGALRDNRRDGLVREIRGDAVRLEQALGMGLAHEKSGAERG